MSSSPSKRNVITEPVAAWDFRAGPNDLLGSLHAKAVGGAQLTAAGAVLDWHVEADVCATLAETGAEIRTRIEAARDASRCEGVTFAGEDQMWLMKWSDPADESLFIATALREGALFKRGAYNYAAIAHDDAAIDAMFARMPRDNFLRSRPEQIAWQANALRAAAAGEVVARARLARASRSMPLLRVAGRPTGWTSSPPGRRATSTITTSTCSASATCSGRGDAAPTGPPAATSGSPPVARS